MLSPRLDKFKKVRDNLFNFRCPYCGDSQKSRSKARGYFYRKKNDYFYRCHNCAKGTTFGKVLEYIDPETYKQYVMERWRGSAPNTKEPEFNFTAPKFKKKDPKLESLTPINKLNADHPARQFVESRQIPEEFYSDLYLCTKFFSWAKISSKQDHPRLVIPFRDETGEVFAAQGRAFGKETPKYLTVKFQDKPKIFGLDRADLSRKIHVVEGPIDSLFVDNCLAMGGADFGNLPEDATIILDNEPSPHKDINDMILAGMTSDDVQELIKQNTYNGLLATARLSAWKRI